MTVSLFFPFSVPNYFFSVGPLPYFFLSLFYLRFEICSIDILFQGFNTGVVHYRLDRMRQSELYNSYLNKEKVTELVKRSVRK